MHRLSDENKAYDGMKNSYVFIWSNSNRCILAFPSGCAVFLIGLESQTNTHGKIL